MSCYRCGHPMRPTPVRVAQAPGTRQHCGRGLCHVCYNHAVECGTLHEWSPLRRNLIGDLVDDIEWLVRTGESPERWPQRVGKTAQTINRQLYRAGRPDLARMIGSVALRERAA